MRRIDEVICNGNIKIKYTQTDGEGGRILHTVDINELAQDEFYEALSDLKAVDREILELDLPQNRISIRGVTFCYNENDTMGAKVHYTLFMPKAMKTIRYTTPKHMCKDMFYMFSDEIVVLSKESENLLNKVACEALDYLDGKRAQLTLDEVAEIGAFAVDETNSNKKGKVIDISKIPKTN